MSSILGPRTVLDFMRQRYPPTLFVLTRQETLQGASQSILACCQGAQPNTTNTVRHITHHTCILPTQRLATAPAKHTVKRQEDSNISTCCLPDVSRSKTPAPGRQAAVLPPLHPLGAQLLSASAYCLHMNHREQQLPKSRLLSAAGKYVAAAFDNLNCYAVMQTTCLAV